MSKRYTFTTPYKDAYEIVDRDIDKAMKPEDVADLLNRQVQRIAELEEQLQECIRPKFKIGQEVYTIRHNNHIYHTRIDEIKVVGINGKNEIFYYYDQPGSYAHWEEVEDNLFSTKAEAEAKLKELTAKNV